jgi:hypothetical protein
MSGIACMKYGKHIQSFASHSENVGPVISAPRWGSTVHRWIAFQVEPGSTRGTRTVPEGRAPRAHGSTLPALR